MVRVFRDGQIIHPDQLRGGALHPDVDTTDLADESVTDFELVAAGYVRSEGSGWWTAPDGSRHNGRKAAAAHLAS